jgi:ribulose-5-phosphate 4-epimerase/fuculose-1-phosphate aldolase
MEAMRGEAGVRHRYQPVQRDTYLLHGALIDELARWCEVFHAEGLAPEEGGASAGNLSFRTTAGFVITPTRSKLKAGLSSDDFVEVVRLEIQGDEQFRVHFLGGGARQEKMPSSDAPMHHLIYAHRPDVVAVFHGHDPYVLAAADRLGVAVTPQETQFGTLADARETVRSLGQHDYLVRRGHGFVAVGRTLERAGKLALDVHRRAKALVGG